jgi:hypothetical protein
MSTSVTVPSAAAPELLPSLPPQKRMKVVVTMTPVAQHHQQQPGQLQLGPPSQQQQSLVFTHLVVVATGATPDAVQLAPTLSPLKRKACFYS